MHHLWVCGHSILRQVSIEPWWGIADTLDSDGQLEHKRGMNHIAPNEVWENGFTIAFHDKAK